MASYPGEQTKIPKRLAEALEYQTLTHLIPKNVLAKLLQHNFLLSLRYKSKAFDPTKAGGEALSSFEPPQNDNVDQTECLSDDDGLLGKAFGQLSPLARRFVEKPPAYKASPFDAPSLKRDLNSLECEEDQKADVSYVKLTKHHQNMAKLANTIEDVNQAAIRNRHMEELECLLRHIGPTDQGKYNPLFWVRLNGQHILTDITVEKLHLVLQNITAVTNLADASNQQVIRQTLELCACHVTRVMKIGLQEESLSVTNAIAASYLILLIITHNLCDNFMLYDKYISTAVDCFSSTVHAFVSRQLARKEARPFTFTVELFLGSILKAVKLGYLSDEKYATSLIYSLVELLLLDSYYSNELSAASLENLKVSSSFGLRAFFENIPSQRLGILNELLQHASSLSSSKKSIRKKLHKLSLPFLLLSMLQTLNSYSFDADRGKLALTEFIQHHQSVSNELMTYIDYVNEELIRRCSVDIANNKAILENYVQDLTVMVVKPEWSIAELVLTSLLKKLLLFYSPSKLSPFAMELVALNTIKTIGTAIQEIILQGRAVRKGALLYLPSYEELPDLLFSFQICRGGLQQAGLEEAQRFTWHRQIDCLLTLKAIEHDSPEIQSDLDNLLLKSLRDKATSDRYDFLIPHEPKNCSVDYFHTMQVSELANLYHPFLKLIISLLERDKVKLMAGAVRCLSVLAEKDSELLMHPIVRNTIEEKLRNASASVKDAILDLILQNDAGITFFRSINLNFNDESISVRKKVLQLNTQIYDRTDQISIKIHVALRLLMETEDENDNIAIPAQNALLQRWILKSANTKALPQEREVEAKSSVVLIANLLEKGEGISKMFVRFLNQYVLKEGLHEETVFKNILSSGNLFTRKAVELAIGLHYEDEAGTMEVRNVNLKILKLLCIMSSCSVSFITKDQIMMLYPYLSAADRSEFDYLHLRILKNAFAQLPNFKPTFLLELETIILNKLPKMNTLELEEGIPLALAIATRRQNNRRLAKACDSSVGLLIPYLTRLKSNPGSLQLDGKLQQLILLITGFSRFCSGAAFAQKLPSLGSSETLLEFTAKFLLILCGSDNLPAIRKVAMRSLLKLGTTFPRLFNSHHFIKLIDTEIKEGTYDMKLVIISSLNFLLVSEEEKTAKNPTTSFNSDARESSTRSNDSICAGLVSRYLSEVLHFCVKNALDREQRCVLEFISHVLNFGYANPSKCIPTLIAVACSEEALNRESTLKILADMFELHESMVFNGLNRGLKLAFNHVCQKDWALHPINTMMFRGLQKLFMKSHKMVNGFLTTMKKHFGEKLIDECNKNPGKGALVVILLNVACLSFKEGAQVVPFLDELEDAIEQAVELIKYSEHSSPESKKVRARLIKHKVQFELTKEFLSKIIAQGNDDQNEDSGKAPKIAARCLRNINDLSKALVDVEDANVDKVLKEFGSLS
ncbi:LAMI_0H18360g1_1 [Lachancea mirantina]|uniref:Sister chromatid cohesion protein n=1 Tax=Lachancea mirantina TaxID=1230905 RepID=A0A1G4KJI9_9SACH|nr:LAMI_0H18360g1_1 [Lachancea mirantina]